jgi:capsular polysaccharide biosynthesis protein
MTTPLTTPRTTQYQLALFQIDSMRKDGKFVGADGSTVPEGQGIVMAHLNECHELLEMVRVTFPFPFSLLSYFLTSRSLLPYFPFPRLP